MKIIFERMIFHQTETHPIAAMLVGIGSTFLLGTAKT